MSLIYQLVAILRLHRVTRNDKSKLFKEKKAIIYSVLPSKKGFTMMELLMALSLISISVLALMVTLTSSQAYRQAGAQVIGRRQRNLEQCAALAKEKMDDIKQRLANNFSSLPNGSGSGAFDIAFYRFSTDISDAVADGGFPNRIKRVRVRCFKDEDSDNAIDGFEDQFTLYSAVVNREENW